MFRLHISVNNITFVEILNRNTDKLFENMPLYKYLFLVMLAMVVLGDLRAQTTSTIITFEPSTVKGKNTNNKSGGDTIYKDGVKIVCDVAAFNYYNTDYRFYSGCDVEITSLVGLMTKIKFTCTEKSKFTAGSPYGFYLATWSTKGYSYNDDIGTWSNSTGVNYLTIISSKQAVHATKIEVTVEKFPNTTTISSAGYATYCCKNAVDYSKAYGLKAFKARYDKDTKRIVLTPVGVVPANTPVVLKGDKGLHGFPNASGSTDVVSDNELKVAQEDMECTGNMWILVKKSNGVGFSPATKGSTLKKGKCYIVIDSESTSQAKFADLDETTGIARIEAPAVPSDGKSYNLAGQRVGPDYKGIVIVGGKKVVRR